MELTEDEKAQALEAALGRKLAAAEEAEALRVREAEEAEALRAQEEEGRKIEALRKSSPAEVCGLDSGGSISYIRNPNGSVRERLIRHGGTGYHHTHEDELGVWMYRPA